MKVELVQGIRLPNTNNGIRPIHKYIETDIKPNVGDYITNDSLWKDPYEYKVNYVELNLQDNEARVVLDDLVVGTEDAITQMEDVAVKCHGWSKGGFMFR